MITTCDSSSDEFDWMALDVPDEEHLAKTFLQGERSLASIQGDDALQKILDEFLTRADNEPLLVSSAVTGEIRLRASASTACLLLDGRTAEVLAATLRGESSTARDRMDMTVRMRRRTD